MKLSLTPGTTSQIVHVFIQDSAVTTGAGKTALAFGDITAYYVRAGGTLTALTMETISTLGTWASTGNDYLGFKLLHDTNAPGVYELDLPNNILAAGANQVVLQLRATGAAPCNLEIQLAAIPTNVMQIGGVVQSLTDLKDFVDTGYDPSTHKVAGVVLTDTCTTNTDMRGTNSAALASVCTELRLAELDAANLPTDVANVGTQIGTPVALDSGTASIAGMLTKMADDNGGASFDATTDSLEKLYGSIVIGVPTSVTAGSAVVTTGTVISGTYAATFLDNGTDYVLAPVDPGGLDAYLVYTLTSGQKPNTVNINGCFTSGPARYVNVYAYNWVTASWDQLTDASNRMNNSASDLNYAYTLLNDHYDPTTLAVHVRFYSTSTTTTDRLNLDQVLVEVVSAGATAADIANAVYDRMAYTVYEGGIWIDTVNGTAGTDLGYNGIPTRPVLTYADALTLATALGVKRFYLKPASSITLTQDHTGWKFIGAGTIALGGQTIANAIFEQIYTVSGIGLGDDALFIDCGIGACTLAHVYFESCMFKGDLTLTASKAYYMHNCSDAVESGMTTFNFAANANVYLRDWRGGVEIAGLAATNEALIDGAGRVIIAATSTAGTITIRGHFTIEDNVAGGFVVGGGTLTDTARWAEDQSVASVTGAVGSVTGNVGGSVASVTGAVASVTGAVGSVTGNVGGNVVGSVASVTGAVGSVTGAVGSVTGNIGGNVVGSVASVTGAVGSVTGNVGGSVASVVGNVGGNVTGSVASVVGNVGGNVTGSVASVTGAVGSVTGTVTVGTNNDKTGYALTVTPPTSADIKTAIEADGSKIDHIWETTEDDGGVRRFSTNALEQAPTGGSAPTANDIKTALEADGSKLDHIWETTEDDGGVRRFSTNALEQAPTGGSAPTVTQIRQEMDANSAQLAAIVEDTGTTIPNQITALNNLSSAQAQTAATAALNAYDPPTKAELDTAVTTIRGADDDTLKTLSDQIDGVDVDNTALANDTADILEDIVDIKGTGFVKDSNSLVNITGSTPTNITVETTVIE